LRFRFESTYGPPYSKNLANLISNYDSYWEQIKDKIEDFPFWKIFPAETLENLEEFLEPRKNFSRDSWIETTASVHYLRHICKEGEGAKDTFEKYNKWREIIYCSEPDREIDFKDFKVVWDALDEYGLLDSKHIRLK